MWLIQLSSISFNLTIHKPKFNNIHKQKQGRCVFAGNVTIIRTKMKEKKKLNKPGKWIKNGGWITFLDIEELHGDLESISVLLISGARSDIIGMVCSMSDGENDGEHYSDHHDDPEEPTTTATSRAWFRHHFFSSFGSIPTSMDMHLGDC